MRLFNGETVFRIGDVVSVVNETKIWFSMTRHKQHNNVYVVIGVNPHTHAHDGGHSQLLHVVCANNKNANIEQASGYWFDPTKTAF